MALIYTAMGVGAGLAGASMAAALQTPWVLGSFAALLFLLSLSMFDVYQLQLPSALQSRLSETSGNLRGGRFLGVFVMGALSAMIVGPCVAAPLAGALLYISQTGNVWTGGWALFAMAMGMSVPLLLTGVSAGSLLPRAGAWMNGVKRVFGLLLIATSIWMLNAVLPPAAMMCLVGAYAILCAVYMRVFESTHEHSAKGITGQRFAKMAGVVMLLAGVFELIGAASGGRSVLQPLEHLRGGGGAVQAAQSEVKFKRIRTVQELEQELAKATTPVLLDFYADWCVSCKEMEHFTFSDKKVAETMGKYTLLQADVTANNEADRALMKKFSLFGPPALVMFGKSGKEITKARVIGYMAKEPFLAHLGNHPDA
jgi:thioredoxin:protein disulfide reductase